MFISGVGLSLAERGMRRPQVTVVEKCKSASDAQVGRLEHGMCVASTACLLLFSIAQIVYFCLV